MLDSNHNDELYSSDPENYRLEMNPVLLDKEALVMRKIANLKIELDQIHAQMYFVANNLLDILQAQVLITIQQVFARSRSACSTDTLLSHISDSKPKAALAIKKLQRKDLIVNVGDRREPKWVPTVTGASVASLIFERNPNIL